MSCLIRFLNEFQDGSIFFSKVVGYAWFLVQTTLHTINRCLSNFAHAINGSPYNYKVSERILQKLTKLLKNKPPYQAGLCAALQKRLSHFPVPLLFMRE